MERFELLSKLGEGLYGSVWKCVDKESRQVVAVKCFKEAHTDDHILRMARREIRLLRASEHPNTVALHDAFSCRFGRLYTVMEYVPHTLVDHLDSHRESLPAESIKLIAWQILQATAFLHASKIIHRDITPSNVLISEEFHVKLCDFGFARSIASAYDNTLTEYITTRWYRAPEVLVGSGNYGPPADVWSVGCLFVEMLMGRPLFPGNDSPDQMWRIMQTLGPLPDSLIQTMKINHNVSEIRIPLAQELTPLETRLPVVDNLVWDVVRACLCLEPSQRLTAQEVLALPYFDGIYELTRGTSLQQAYDRAYDVAVHRGSPAASCLWASSSLCVEARGFALATAEAIASEDMEEETTISKSVNGSGQQMLVCSQMLLSSGKQHSMESSLSDTDVGLGRGDSGRVSAASSTQSSTRSAVDALGALALGTSGQAGHRSQMSQRVSEGNIFIPPSYGWTAEQQQHHPVVNNMMYGRFSSSGHLASLSSDNVPPLPPLAPVRSNINRR